MPLSSTKKGCQNRHATVKDISITLKAQKLEEKQLDANNILQ